MDDSEKVKITVVSGIPFIWNAKDVYHARKKHRIIGILSGCLPRMPNQNTLLGLPLRLSFEETRLLLDQGFANLEVIDAEYVKSNVSGAENLSSKYDELRENLYAQQNELYKEERRKTIEQKADTIIEGKRKRQLEKMQGLKGKKKKRSKASSVSTSDESMDFEVDRDAVIQEELQKISDVPRKSLSVQLFTESPWSKAVSMNGQSFTFPDSDRDNLRYQVFKDLWDKGLYVTTGSKFGTDFLAYPGDPVRYHAFFMVVCTGYGDQLPGLDLVTLGRLSSQVKKTVVLATVKPDAAVDYISLNWAGLQF